jgi:hypothetical protein
VRIGVIGLRILPPLVTVLVALAVGISQILVLDDGVQIVFLAHLSLLRIIVRVDLARYRLVETKSMVNVFELPWWHPAVWGVASLLYFNSCLLLREELIFICAEIAEQGSSLRSRLKIETPHKGRSLLLLVVPALLRQSSYWRHVPPNPQHVTKV